MAAQHNSLRAKSGTLEMKVDRMAHKSKWKHYLFKVTSQTYLHYFKVDNPGKIEGQLLLVSITKVESNPVKGAQFPFEVHFRGKAMSGANSPWIINASSNDERMEWMEAIKPGSSSFLRKRAELSTPLPQTIPPPPAYSPPELAAMQPSRSPQPSPVHHQSPVGSQPYQSPQHGTVYHQQQPPAPVVGAQTTPVQQPMMSRFPPNMDPTHSWHGHTNTTGLHPERQRQMSSPSPIPQDYVEPTSFSPDMSRQLDMSTPPQLSVNPNGQPPIPPRTRNTISHTERNPPAIKNLARSSTEKRSQGAQNGHLSLKDEDNSYIKMSSPTHVNAPVEIKPQKPVPAPRRKAPGQQQHGDNNEYLDLVAETDSGPPKPARRRQVRPDVSSLEELARNFPPEQLSMMINMLQQVAMSQATPQSEQDVENAWKVPNETNPTNPSMDEKDSSTLKGNFKRLVSYTPMLPAERILVTDEDDDDDYTPRPEWAKAIGKSTSQSPINKEAPELDTLSSLQEEALYIQRSSIDGLEVIGEGQFGKVFKAQMKRGYDEISVAVKTTKKMTTDKDREAFMWEMNVMSQMMHPNIVRLFGLVKDDVVTPWIVLEYLPHGDLKNFLTKNLRPIQKLIKYMIDVSMGMHYISERGLVHRDLAARNILVGDNEICKVADFGLLRELPKDESIYEMHTNVPCPVRWMAPECISERQFSVGSDVWSYGILMWEMFNPSKTPYEGLGNLEVVTKVAKGHRLNVPEDAPSIIARIMKSCWSKNREKRPSFLLISTLLTKVTL